MLMSKKRARDPGLRPSLRNSSQPLNCRIADHEAGIRVRQVKSEQADLALYTTDDADGFIKVCLSMPWRMHQRYEHLLSPLPPAGR